MAVYETREAFASAVQGIIGDRTDDDAIAFVQNMFDTYDGANHGITQEAHNKAIEDARAETEATWRKKYMDAFFSKPDESISGTNPPDGMDGSGTPSNPKSIEDIFKTM